MEHPRRRVYGRRLGYRLRPARQALLERVLPRLRIDLPEDERAQLDVARLFTAPPADLWLEIGFGGGEHLAQQLRANPDVGIIGCEPFVQGVAALLSRLEADGTGDRARLFPDDGRLLLERLPDASIGRLFVLFPDPWPKKRHHKRRLIDAETLAGFARVLKDGAEFRWASDDRDYVAWTLERVAANGAFARQEISGGDAGLLRPVDWPETRYEQKARAAGRVPVFLRFLRIPR